MKRNQATNLRIILLYFAVIAVIIFVVSGLLGSGDNGRTTYASVV